MSQPILYYSIITQLNPEADETRAVEPTPLSKTREGKWVNKVPITQHLTFKKVTQQNTPYLLRYLAVKNNDIMRQYINYIDEPENYGWPEFVMYENAFNKIIKETGINQRCIDIYMNGTTEADKICTIMGQGYFNDKVFKADDPVMHSLKEIQKQVEEERLLSVAESGHPAIQEYLKQKRQPLWQQQPAEEQKEATDADAHKKLVLNPTNWFRQMVNKELEAKHKLVQDTAAASIPIAIGTPILGGDGAPDSYRDAPEGELPNYLKRVQ